MKRAKTARLRDLGEWRGGNTPSRANTAYWTDGTIPWVSPKDMKVAEVTSSEDRVSEAALKEGRVSLVPEGSVLVVTRSGILSHTLPVAVTKAPVTINQDLKALIPKPGILPTYVAHALRGASRRILKECSKHGTTVASIETNALLDFEISLVNEDEQRRIVAELEKQFSRLDEAVANLKRVKANLKRYVASVLDASTGGGLLEERLERERPWRQTTLGSVADVIDPNPSHRMPAYVADGFPLISSENFVGSEGIDFARGKKVAEETLRKQRDLFRIESGDFALSRIGTIGKTRFLPIDRTYCLSHALVVIKVKVPEVDKRWLRYAVSSNRVLSQARDGVQSVGVPDLGMGKIRTFELPLPTLEVQQLIASEVDRRLSVVREVDAEVDANLKRAQALRQAVLARAFVY